MKNNKIPFFDLVEKFTDKYWHRELSEDEDFVFWFTAQMKAESGFKPDALSVAGACGLMQIMPLTYREIRLRLRHLKADIFDVESNIEAGIWYDRWIFDHPLREIFGDMDDTMCAVIAGYNCGPSRIKKLIEENYLKNYSELEKCIPYRETREYVRRVIAFRDEFIRKNVSIKSEGICASPQ